MLGPDATLRRGYSITMNDRGQIIRTTAVVRPEMKSVPASVTANSVQKFIKTTNVRLNGAMQTTHATNSTTQNDRSINVVSDALPVDRLWYGEPNALSNAVDYSKFRSRSHDVVIRVYDAADNV